MAEVHPAISEAPASLPRTLRYTDATYASLNSACPGFGAVDRSTQSRRSSTRVSVAPWRVLCTTDVANGTGVTSRVVTWPTTG